MGMPGRTWQPIRRLCSSLIRRPMPSPSMRRLPGFFEFRPSFIEHFAPFRFVYLQPERF
jgi:hypothetical protein